MSGRAQIVPGPWRVPEASRPSEPAPVREAGERAHRVVLGWVVRECEVALGHDPSAHEFARWANHQSDARGEYCLFGRAISEAEAAVILRHPAREVTVRAARAMARPGLGLVAMPSRGRG